jgi:hypothetical protein
VAFAGISAMIEAMCSSPKSSLSERLQEAQHLQALEGNPLTEDELVMFEMFEREAWSHERRREYIRAQFAIEAAGSAAE